MTTGERLAEAANALAERVESQLQVSYLPGPLALRLAVLAGEDEIIYVDGHIADSTRVEVVVFTTRRVIYGSDQRTLVDASAWSRSALEGVAFEPNPVSDGESWALRWPPHVQIALVYPSTTLRLPINKDQPTRATREALPAFLPSLLEDLDRR